MAVSGVTLETPPDMQIKGTHQVNALPASRSDMLLLSLSEISVETRDRLQTQQALTPSNPTLAMSLSLFSTTIAELRLVT